MTQPRPSRFFLMFLSLLTISCTVQAEDWPQWLGPQRDGIWREEGILRKFPEGGPKVLWRVPVGGGYAGPAVADGKVYITDRTLAEGQRNPQNQFDNKRGIKGSEQVLCIDDKTGKIIWKHEYPSTYKISYAVGPRTTPVIDNGNVYTIGAMGDLYCLNAKTGKVIWSKNFINDYGARVPFWGWASTPLIDGDKLICLVGGKGSVVVAFDKTNGKELWKALSLNQAEIGYCPPMIYEAGGKRQLIIWHPESINSLNPENGKSYWSERFFVKANLTIPTPRLENNILFLTSFYNGSMALKLDKEKPAASVLWKGKGRGERPQQTKDLHAIMATPYMEDGYVYGVGSYGELRCLKAETGERVWADFQATGTKQQNADRWNNAFIVRHNDECFLFTEKGELVIARLTPKGYTEIDRAKILAPTTRAMGLRRVVWTHPAFANKSMYARNDKEIVRVSLAKE